MFILNVFYVVFRPNTVRVRFPYIPFSALVIFIGGYFIGGSHSSFQEYIINFDPEILQLIQEAKHMQRLSLDVSVTVVTFSFYFAKF